MKTQLLAVLIFSLSIACSQAQTWSALGTGLSGGTTGASTYSLAIYNNDLIVGGQFTNAGGVPANYIARWNGSAWDSLGSGFAGGNGNSEAWTLMPYNGELYASGDFTQAGGMTVDNIARWNGTSWSTVGVGISGSTRHWAEDMLVWNGELYVAGEYSEAGGVPARNGIAKWNGTGWTSLTPGRKYSYLTDPSARNICLFGGELHIAGNFDSIGGIAANSAARWNGSSWAPLGSGFGSSDYIMCLAEFNGELYAGGAFSTAGGVPASNIARWNGSTWSPVGNGTDSRISAMCVYNGALYVGGIFGTAGGLPSPFLARWDGTNWSSVGTINGEVRTMIVYNNELVIAGRTSTINGNPYNRIAKLNWPVGTKDLDRINEVRLFPNPANHSFRMTSPVGIDQIEISDPSGRLIQRRKLDGAKETRIEIEETGLYFIKLVSGNATLVRKIFISGS